MESTKELRRICQGPRKDSDSWHMKHIARKPSIYITWLLLHTSISANQTTLLFVLIGLFSAFILTIGTKLAFFAGAFLLQIWFVMDMVDGEIARYRKQTSFTGAYFDHITHYIIHPIIFIGIGIGLFRIYSDVSILLISMLAGYSVYMITISGDIYELILYHELNSLKVSKPNFSIKEDEKLKRLRQNKINFLKKLFSGLHTVCTFPFIMNALLIITLANLFMRYDLMKPFILFYAISATFVWIVRIAFFIMSKKIDAELK